MISVTSASPMAVRRLSKFSHKPRNGKEEQSGARGKLQCVIDPLSAECVLA